MYFNNIYPCQVNYDGRFVLGPVPHAEIPYYVEDLVSGGPQPTAQMEERVAKTQFEVLKMHNRNVHGILIY